MDGNEKINLKVIMEELNEMKKRDINNASNIKVLVRRMIKEDNTVMSFGFPLRTEPEIDKLQEALQRKRFTEKLVCFNILHTLVRTFCLNLKRFYSIVT